MAGRSQGHKHVQTAIAWLAQRPLVRCDPDLGTALVAVGNDVPYSVGQDAKYLHSPDETLLVLAIPSTQKGAREILSLAHPMVHLFPGATLAGLFQSCCPESMPALCS